MSSQCPPLCPENARYICHKRRSSVSLFPVDLSHKQITKGPEDCEHHTPAMVGTGKTHIARLTNRQARKKRNIHEKNSQLSRGHCADSNLERPLLRPGIRSNGKRDCASRRCGSRHAFLQTTLPGAYSERLLKQNSERTDSNDERTRTIISSWPVLFTNNPRLEIDSKSANSLTQSLTNCGFSL